MKRINTRGVVCKCGTFRHLNPSPFMAFLIHTPKVLLNNNNTDNNKNKNKNNNKSTPYYICERRYIFIFGTHYPVVRFNAKLHCKYQQNSLPPISKYLIVCKNSLKNLITIIIFIVIISIT